MTRSRHDRSLSFGSAAAAYERGRPSYPPEAIDWLLPRGARHVLDLGAGTGKLTTRLVERGLDVVAVDPIPDMLEVLRTSLPETRALLGTAEEIPLEDNSVDAVLVAQAWHWVDPERAIPEVARVLRPGGRWVFSVTHPVRWCLPDDPGPAGLTVTRSYFDRRAYVEQDDSGRATYVEHHRTLGDRVREIRAAGLVLADLVEPEWPAEAAREWGHWSRLRGELIPGTAILVCVKP